MPEKPGGMAEAPNAEEVKKQRVAELEREIHQKKEYLAVMVGDKGEWLACKRYVDMLHRQLGNNEFYPAAEKKKQEDLAKHQGVIEENRWLVLRKVQNPTCSGIGLSNR